jgi:hypothetical protein
VAARGAAEAACHVHPERDERGAHEEAGADAGVEPRAAEGAAGRVDGAGVGEHGEAGAGRLERRRQRQAHLRRGGGEPIPHAVSRAKPAQRCRAAKKRLLEGRERVGRPVVHTAQREDARAHEADVAAHVGAQAHGVPVPLEPEPLQLHDGLHRVSRERGIAPRVHGEIGLDGGEPVVFVAEVHVGPARARPDAGPRRQRPFGAHLHQEPPIAQLEGGVFPPRHAGACLKAGEDAARERPLHLERRAALVRDWRPQVPADEDGRIRSVAHRATTRVGPAASAEAEERRWFSIRPVPFAPGTSHHPDLGGCFGPGCRVATGWDFVGDAFNADPTSPSYKPVPVPDPHPDDCNAHGTPHAVPGGQRYTVPNNGYVVKISVLEALGDDSNQAHWETWTSPVITIARP